MKTATSLQASRKLRLGRRALAALGLLALAVGGTGWWNSIDPRPARMRLPTSVASWPLGFSPDGKAFLTADGSPESEVIRAWDVATGRRGASWPLKIGGHVPTVAFSPDGRIVALAIIKVSSTARVEVADAVTGQPRASFDAGEPWVYRLAWSPDGGLLIAHLGDGHRLTRIATFDPTTGRIASSRAVDVPALANVDQVSPDGRLANLFRASGPAVELLDPESGRTITLANPASLSPVFRGSVDYSDDCRTLGLGREDGTVELWDLPGRKLLKSIRVHPAGTDFATTRIAPDGRTFATTAWPGRDTSTFGGLYSDFRQAVIGPDYRPTGRVVLVDFASGRVLGRSFTSIRPIYSPDGRTLLTQDGDRGVLLRDVPAAPQ